MRSKFDPVTLKINRFQTLVRTKYAPSFVKIHRRMLILECSQGCYTVKNLPSDLDLWPRKSIEFQTLLRTKYVPSLVKIHWRMLILECSQGLWRTDGSVTISPRNLVGEGIIKVLVLRQHRPLKISADGMFLLLYRKKIVAVPHFWRKRNSNLPPNLSFQGCRWHGRVLTNVWMTDQSKTKVKIQHGYEWKHCPCQF
jgi:hypothetical protein